MPVVTLDEYFRDSTARGYVPTEEERGRALVLLSRVGALLNHLGIDADQTSGHRTRAKTLELRAAGYGAALGGTHETAEGIDLADEGGAIDDTIDDALLERFNLYREHPASTRGWVHLSSKPPRSQRRTFYP